MPGTCGGVEKTDTGGKTQGLEEPACKHHSMRACLPRPRRCSNSLAKDRASGWLTNRLLDRRRRASDPFPLRMRRKPPHTRRWKKRSDGTETRTRHRRDRKKSPHFPRLIPSHLIPIPYHSAPSHAPATSAQRPPFRPELDQSYRSPFGPLAARAHRPGKGGGGRSVAPPPPGAAPSVPPIPSLYNKPSACARTAERSCWHCYAGPRTRGPGRRPQRPRRRRLCRQPPPLPPSPPRSWTRTCRLTGAGRPSLDAARWGAEKFRVCGRRRVLLVHRGSR